MSIKRQELAVGVFVLGGLVLIGALMLSFSKGFTPRGSTYHLTMATRDVGGVQEGVTVRMAGVQIGQVDAVDYDSATLEVHLRLRIQNKYQIPRNAVFSIESAGFLGDKFVSVTPQARSDDYLQPGDRVDSRVAFNLEEAARSAMGLVDNADRTISNLNAAVVRIDKTLLAEETLTNITLAMENFRKISDETLATVQGFRGLSERAGGTFDRLDLLVETNAPTVSASLSNVMVFTEQLQAVSNLVHFSDNLTELGTDLRETLAGNREDIAATLQNLEATTASLRNISSNLESGRGLVGSLLSDTNLDLQVSLTLSNLTILSSNLNRFGLLYKPKRPKTPRTNAPVKSPFADKWPFPR